MTTWQPDLILDGFETLELPLPLAVPAPGEPEDDASALVGTLVRRQGGPRHERALLYIHGWSDYFFQAHLADFADSIGFDLYAVDLRRYGRSLREGQLAGFITDLDEYSQELDAALDVIREDYERVSVMAHSTGGLVAALWADQRRGEIDALILNSPWLDLQGSPMLRAVTAPVLQRMRGNYPTTVIPLPNNGLYNRAINAEHDGEWVVDEALKGGPNFAIRVGWLAAILAGHDRVAAGLSIDAPVLTLISARSDFRRKWDESLMSSDTVLDVDKLAVRAVRLGPHVTVVRIDGGMHDLALSAAPARTRYFDEIARWVRGYLD